MFSSLGHIQTFGLRFGRLEGGFTSLSPPCRRDGVGQSGCPVFSPVCRLTPGGRSLGNSSSQDSPVRALGMAPGTGGREAGAADGKEAL